METNFLSLLPQWACHWLRLGAVLLLTTMLTACQQSDKYEGSSTKILESTDSNLSIATFAGGCFWCTESDFDKLPGVIATISGYIGGTVVNPTYRQVVAGETGHVEAVEVYFDSTKTDFAKLLAAYWLTIDPLTPNQQFCDSGTQYRSAIFYHNDEQRKLAEASRVTLETSGRFMQPIVTEILPASVFYPAEEYHQDYYIKNPLRYTYYRKNCGRDARLAELWESSD
ncbi:peptide-methionine (S)-S-oxide reductase [Nitrosomonas cryotolerans]|uniref:Peptide methionine sulfoxide reductase MsrA n=1 Tax=Nitrosomonas cryotolerans ATCC 49181 TaxID=1131553 RepID=A0A1N6H8L8_9PROT|nr:peptide-methionine (S)-S-oxide reductase MsrA [Nitrosomonas cryotolerans]SFP79905.1 peptide-methionine (S)-S-oxide reductase [Nitrosomonas cryotolerans]SIO16090.1 peptide-methionine (S)-S-oxide reductase [Nitrosomonas cryotolerans ATCC 49181]